MRDGRHFEALSGPFKPAADGTTEVCGVRLLGAPALDLINIYRPPICLVEANERVDHFDPDALPDGDNTVVTGEINAHHPLWDSNGEEAGEVGDRVAAWLDGRGWSVLRASSRCRSVERASLFQVSNLLLEGLFLDENGEP